MITNLIRPDQSRYAPLDAVDFVQDISNRDKENLYTVPGWYEIIHNANNVIPEMYMINGKITACITIGGDYYCYINKRFYTSKKEVEQLSRIGAFI